MDSESPPVEFSPDSSEHEGLLSGNSCEEAGVYEATVEACGFGFFQIKLLLICGWAIASDSVEVQTVSFVLPSACDLQLSSNDKGWLNAVIFVGMMLGGYGFGGAADIKGRRFILLLSMSINGFFGLASAFAPSFEVFLVARLLSGVGVGAAMPVLFSYFVEFMSKHRRGPMIGFLASFWMCGNILASGIAWLVIPRVDVGFNIGSLWFGSWRIFVAVCSIPSLSSACFIFLMPESPKYLQKVGKLDEAATVFAYMFRSNNGNTKPLPPEIKEFPLNQTTNNAAGSINNSRNQDMCTFCQCLYSICGTLVKVWQSTKVLFQEQYFSSTVVLLFVWFTLSFGYYGLWMWFPEIFQRIRNGGSSCGGDVVSVNVTQVLPCLEQVAQDQEVYMESFLIALSNLPGNIITILVINKLGRRQLLAVAMVASGISVFFFWFVQTRVEMLVMSCVFSGVSVAGWNALDALTLEQYPTDLRSTSFGLQTGIARIAAVLGNVVFGELVDVHCSIPLLLVSAMLIAGGLSAIKLKKTDQNALK